MTEVAISSKPVYSIGVVSELLGVNPHTIRAWEKAGVVDPPGRRSGKRFYSDCDLKRLQFVQNLTIAEGLTLPAVTHFLKLYPCWQMDDCPGCMSRTLNAGCSKPCWKESGTYCHVSADENLCTKCQFRHQHDQNKQPPIE